MITCVGENQIKVDDSDLKQNDTLKLGHLQINFCVSKVFPTTRHHLQICLFFYTTPSNLYQILFFYCEEFQKHSGYTD